MAGRKNTGVQEHFGYQKVGGRRRQGRVNRVFESVAGRYDLMNDLMSAGAHRLWKRHLINRLRPEPGMRLLDIAGGTGDIAIRFLDALGENAGGARVTVSDISRKMLEAGEARAVDAGYLKEIAWVRANAEKLPLKADSFDAAACAFGIRNVTNIGKALTEAYRVLKPLGRIFVMEFSSAPPPLLEKPYDWYSLNVIPKLGKRVAKDEEAYRYLVESIRRFPPPAVFTGLMREAGFSRVASEPLAGGIVTLYRGRKI